MFTNPDPRQPRLDFLVRVSRMPENKQSPGAQAEAIAKLAALHDLNIVAIIDAGDDRSQR